MRDAKVLVLGLTFKENCPDIRNTRVIDVVNELTSYGMSVDVYDPWVDAAAARAEYGLELCGEPRENIYDAVVLAVPHDEFCLEGGDSIRKFCRSNHVFYDLKSVYPRAESDLRL